MEVFVIDFNHRDVYNHLLTRTCICGGKAEMIVDSAADFEARCSMCHLSTHAYRKPEAAAAHWNNSDDIMDSPLHIFWDDPEAYLEGEIAAIYISDEGFSKISQQGCILSMLSLNTLTKHTHYRKA